MPNGHQRYLCPTSHQTFSESFDSLYYRRHVSPEQIRASFTSTSAKAVADEGLVGQLDLLTTGF
jgi:transposase-like protein